jgi:tyrosinase
MQRDTRTFQYTYPELEKWSDLSPDEKRVRLRTEVNRLYGKTAPVAAISPHVFSALAQVPAAAKAAPAPAAAAFAAAVAPVAAAPAPAAAAPAAAAPAPPAQKVLATALAPVAAAAKKGEIEGIFTR